MVPTSFKGPKSQKEGHFCVQHHILNKYMSIPESIFSKKHDLKRLDGAPLDRHNIIQRWWTKIQCLLLLPRSEIHTKYGFHVDWTKNDWTVKIEQFWLPKKSFEQRSLKLLVNSTKHYLNNKSITQIKFYLANDQLNKSQLNNFFVELSPLWTNLNSSKSLLNT